MKKLIVPAVLCILGIVLTAFSFISGSKNNADDIDIVIEKASFIMPAAHRVYANSEAIDGKYYLFKAKITNNSSQTLEDVTVKYRNSKSYRLDRTNSLWRDVSWTNFSCTLLSQIQK